MSRHGKPFGKTIGPDGIPQDEMRVAEQIALEMHELCSGTALGIDMAERRVALYIHNYDLKKRDQNRWWDSVKSEAMDDDWGELYARLRAASGNPVYRGKKK